MGVVFTLYRSSKIKTLSFTFIRTFSSVHDLCLPVSSSASISLSLQQRLAQFSTDMKLPVITHIITTYDVSHDQHLTVSVNTQQLNAALITAL